MHSHSDPSYIFAKLPHHPAVKGYLYVTKPALEIKKPLKLLL